MTSSFTTSFIKLLSGLMLIMGLASCDRIQQDQATNPTKATVATQPAPFKNLAITVQTDETQIIKLLTYQQERIKQLGQRYVDIYPHDVVITKNQLHAEFTIENISDLYLQQISFKALIGLSNDSYKSPADLFLEIPIDYDLSHSLTTNNQFAPDQIINISVNYNLRDLLLNPTTPNFVKDDVTDNFKVANVLTALQQLSYHDKLQYAQIRVVQLSAPEKKLLTPVLETKSKLLNNDAPAENAPTLNTTDDHSQSAPATLKPATNNPSPSIEK